MDINKVVLIGRLVRDPEVRMTPNGLPLARLRLAINRRPGKDNSPQADFIDIVAWRRLAELCEQMLKKGNRVAVEGALRQRSWQGQDGKLNSRVEVEAQNIQFLEKATLQNHSFASEGESPFEEVNADLNPSGEALHVLNGDLDDDLDDFVFEGGDK